MNNPSLEAVDFRYILLDDYKKLGISENELAVILVSDHLLKQDNKMVTADLLSLKMTLPLQEIDAILVGLMKRGFLSYDATSSGMRTSLEPLKKQLYKQFEMDLMKDRQNLLSAERATVLNDLYAYFEKRLSRTLSPIESDFMNTWLDDGYGEDEIKDALELSLSQGKKTVKSIDKSLRTNRARNDISSEGYSAISQNWNEDIAKTIEIAQTKWLDDDDD